MPGRWVTWSLSDHKPPRTARVEETALIARDRVPDAEVHAPCGGGIGLVVVAEWKSGCVGPRHHGGGSPHMRMLSNPFDESTHGLPKPQGPYVKGTLPLMQ